MKCFSNLNPRSAATKCAAKSLLAATLALAILAATGCERESPSRSARGTGGRAPGSPEPTPVRKASLANSGVGPHQAPSGSAAQNAVGAPTSASPVPPPAIPSGEVIERDRSHWSSELRDIETKVEKLRERARTMSSTQTRERMTQAIAELEGKRRALAEQLDHFDDWRTSAALAWEDVRAGFERAFKELREAYDRAKSHF